MIDPESRLRFVKFAQVSIHSTARSALLACDGLCHSGRLSLCGTVGPWSLRLGAERLWNADEAVAGGGAAWEKEKRWVRRGCGTVKVVLA